MALRVLLVAMVAALGLELPSGESLTGWRESARGWLSSRMVDLSKLAESAGRLVAGAEEPSKVEGDRSFVSSKRDDLAFEAVVEAMASGFASDLAENLDASPAREVTSVVDSSVVTSPTEEGEFTAGDSSQRLESPLEKIGTAVKLTRRAMDAWASLIRPGTDSVIPSGEENSL